MDITTCPRLGDLLVGDRDLLDAVLAFLDANSALRAAATCHAFATALGPSEAIWETFYLATFGDYDLQFDAPMSWSQRFRVAHQRIHLRSVRWHHSTSLDVSGTPPEALARQGAASCVVADWEGGACFVVYGGWTNMSGICCDVHVLRRCTGVAEGTGDWEWTAVPISARHDGPQRATYGPSITAVPDACGDGSSIRLVVHGGVCHGGYRGAQRGLHSILMRCGASGGDDELPRLKARWTGESSHDGAARAYHTATFVPRGGAAHASNAHRVWVFGGFDDATEDGCIAQLAAYDLASSSWEAVFPQGAEPAARLGHTCVELRGALYISGGCTDSSNMKPGEGGEELDDIWRVDLAAPQVDVVWECVSMPGRAPPRALQRCHAASCVGTRILFFGGGRSTTLTNRICAFDTNMASWHAPGRVAGTPPSTRQNAACAVFPGTGYLVVFGGWRRGPMGGDVNLGDTHLLNLDGDLDGDLDSDLDGADGANEVRGHERGRDSAAHWLGGSLALLLASLLLHSLYARPPDDT